MNTSNGIRQLGAFYDNQHYPRGFSRYGDFSIMQADVLHDYGMAMQLLAEGKITPINIEEEHFVKMSQGTSAPNSFIEKTWLHYKKMIDAHKKFISAFESQPKSAYIQQAV